MRSKIHWPIIVGSIAVGLLGCFLLIPKAQTQGAAPTGTYGLTLTRIYNGPDGLGHAEDLPIKWDSKGAIQFLPITGEASLHLMKNSSAATEEWHKGPRRQYVITLTGKGEIEVSDRKIPLGPGSIDLIEDTAGKGHITRNFGDRVTIQLPLVSQDGPDPK